MSRGRKECNPCPHGKLKRNCVECKAERASKTDYITTKSV